MNRAATIFFVTFIFFTSCGNNKAKPEITSKDTANLQLPLPDKLIKLPSSKEERKKLYTNSDTVHIISSYGDTISYSKEIFNDIIDNFPKLYQDPPIHPDTSYLKSKVWVDLTDTAGNKKTISFNSEVGRDTYYVVYAYFLKRKNGIAKYAERRKKLLSLYRTLNSLFGQLNYGGTYFGHQHARIEGYAEFSVYWFSHYEDHFDRPYDITKQRSHYIAGLRQLILDEEEIDYSMVDKQQKALRRKRLFQEVDTLNRLITDNFYLRMAQSFQSDYY